MCWVTRSTTAPLCACSSWRRKARCSRRSLRSPAASSLSASQVGGWGGVGAGGGWALGSANRVGCWSCGLVRAGACATGIWVCYVGSPGFKGRSCSPVVQPGRLPAAPCLARKQVRGEQLPPTCTGLPSHVLPCMCLLGPGPVLDPAPEMYRTLRSTAPLCRELSRRQDEALQLPPREEGAGPGPGLPAQPTRLTAATGGQAGHAAGACVCVFGGGEERG